MTEIQMGFREEFKNTIFLHAISSTQTQAHLSAHRIELDVFKQWKETTLKGYPLWYACTYSLIKNKQTSKQTNKLKTGSKTTVLSPKLTAHLVSLTNRQ